MLPKAMAGKIAILMTMKKKSKRTRKTFKLSIVKNQIASKLLTKMEILTTKTSQLILKALVIRIISNYKKDKETQELKLSLESKLRKLSCFQLVKFYLVMERLWDIDNIIQNTRKRLESQTTENVL